MKATVLAESFNNLSIFIVMSTTAMSTDSSQVDVTLFPSFIMIQFYLNLFYTRGRVMGDKSITSWAN